MKIGPPGATPGGAQVPPATAEHAILAAVHAQPGTLHVVAQADDPVNVAGLSQQITMTAFRGPATWTGYDLVSGHWYTGPDQVLAPTGFLTQTGTSVGDAITIGEGHNAAAGQDRRRDLRHAQPRHEPRHELGDPPRDRLGSRS